MNHHQPTLMSNFSQPSSDLSLGEEREVLRRETEKQALTQLEKARVSLTSSDLLYCISNYSMFNYSPNPWPSLFEQTLLMMDQ